MIKLFGKVIWHMQIKKVLFAIKNFYPDISASGNVLYKLLSVSEECGIKPYVLTRKSNDKQKNIEDIGNITIIRYSVDIPENKMLRKISKQFDTEIVNRDIERKVLSELIDCCSKYDISFVCPITIEEISASIKLKDERPNVLLIPYLFEEIPAYKSMRMVDVVRERKVKQLKNDLYSRSHKIFVFPYIKNYFNDVDNKVIVTDHPMVVDNTSNEILDNSKFKIVYVGGLDRTIRNPTRTLEIFSEIIDNDYLTEFEIEIYGYGNCDRILNRYVTKYPDIISYKGSVTPDCAKEILKNADIILTIGNTKSRLVPSKLFDCVSTGNPIIHFFFEEDDYVDRLKKYSLSECIDLRDNKDENAKKVSDFIKIAKGKKLNFKDIEKSFKKCTPMYVLSIIKDNI